MKTKKKKRKVTCTDYKNLVVPFLHDELDEKQTLALLKHTETCQECKEELKIQYLVREGLKRLEQGQKFDFNRDFKKKIENAREKSLRLSRLQHFFYGMEAFGTVLVLVLLLKDILG